MHKEMLPICGSCGKSAQIAGAAYCPYCGSATQISKQPEPPQGALDALAKADQQNNPKKKWEILTKAEAEYPDCLEVAEALLFLGRLHERSAKRVDFSVIKCYLFQIYLTPEIFSSAKIADMRLEFFNHPQLKRCQALAADAELFTIRYLQRLAGEFVTLFLRGNSQYMRAIFGFSVQSNAPKLLAAPTALMLSNILKDDELSPDERDMLYTALYRGFASQLGGETRWLDEKLRSQQNHVPL